MEQIGVLLVEDECIVREVMERYLTLSGISFASATSGKGALESLQSNIPKVLFTDCELIGTMNGVELAEIVRDRLPETSIIVVSGRGKYQLQAEALGALFFQKPYSLNAVVAKIRELI